MKDIFEFIKMNSSKIEERFQNITPLKSNIKYILEFEIQKKNFVLNSIKKALEDDTIVIYFDDINIDDVAKATKELALINNDSLVKISVLKEYNIITDEIFLYSHESIEKFVQNTIEFKISNIKDIQNKIIVIPYIFKIDKVFESTIFLIKENETISENNSLIKLDTRTKQFIRKFKDSTASIILIPNIVNEKIIQALKLFPVIKSMLSILSSEKKSNKFIFKSSFNYTIIAEDSKNYSTKEKYEHFIILRDIFQYIFSNNSTSEQKLIFFRKALCETSKQNIEVQLNTISADQFKQIYSDTKFLFETFEDGEVSAFLKEKKEVLKEYLSISKDISKDIDTLQNSLMVNVLTILGLVITHTLLKVRLNMSIHQNILILICILSLLLISWFLISFRTAKRIDSINSTLEIVNSHFSFLSTKSDGLKKDMNKIIHTDLNTLNNFLWSSIIINLFLFIGVIAYLCFFLLKLL